MQSILLKLLFTWLSCEGCSAAYIEEIERLLMPVAKGNVRNLLIIINLFVQNAEHHEWTQNWFDLNTESFSGFRKPS